MQTVPSRNYGKSFVDSVPTSFQGAKIGTSILPGWGTAIGAAVGGIYGLGKSILGQNDERERIIRENNIERMNIARANTYRMQSEYAEENPQAYTFANGGYLQGKAFLDNGEVYRDSQGNIGQMPSGAPGTDPYLVNDNAVESALSTKRKYGKTGRTYSQEGERLLKKYAQAEKLANKDPHNRFAYNSNNLNMFNLQQQYQALLNDQEATKRTTGTKQKTKSIYADNAIPVYADGKDTKTRSIADIQKDIDAAITSKQRQRFLAEYGRAIAEANKKANSSSPDVNGAEAQIRYNQWLANNPELARIINGTALSTYYSPNYLAKQSTPATQESTPVPEVQTVTPPTAGVAKPANRSKKKTTTPVASTNYVAPTEAEWDAWYNYNNGYVTPGGVSSSTPDAAAIVAENMTANPEAYENTIVGSERYSPEGYSIRTSDINLPTYGRYAGGDGIGASYAGVDQRMGHIEPTAESTNISKTTEGGNTNNIVGGNPNYPGVSGMDILGMLGQAAPAISNLLTSTRRPEVVNPVYNPYEAAALQILAQQRIDPTTLLQRNMRNSRIANYNAGVMIPNTGMSNAVRVQNNVARMNADAEVLYNTQLQNQQFRNNYANALLPAGQARVAAMQYANEANAQARAAQRNYYDTGISQLGQLATTWQQDANQRRQDDMRMAIANAYFESTIPDWRNIAASYQNRGNYLFNTQRNGITQ
jgi:hypothetical protein